MACPRRPWPGSRDWCENFMLEAGACVPVMSACFVSTMNGTSWPVSAACTWTTCSLLGQNHRTPCSPKQCPHLSGGSLSAEGNTTTSSTPVSNFVQHKDFSLELDQDNYIEAMQTMETKGITGEQLEMGNISKVIAL